MTRQDYILLAGVMARVRRSLVPITYGMEPVTVWRLTVDALAEALPTTNPRFDAERFITACYEGGTN
jgi:hypothetical protein